MCKYISAAAGQRICLMDAFVIVFVHQPRSFPTLYQSFYEVPIGSPCEFSTAVNLDAVFAQNCKVVKHMVI